MRISINHIICCQKKEHDNGLQSQNEVRSNISKTLTAVDQFIGCENITNKQCNIDNIEIKRLCNEIKYYLYSDQVKGLFRLCPGKSLQKNEFGINIERDNAVSKIKNFCNENIPVKLDTTDAAKFVSVNQTISIISLIMELSKKNPEIKKRQNSLMQIFFLAAESLEKTSNDENDLFPVENVLNTFIKPICFTTEVLIEEQNKKIANDNKHTDLDIALISGLKKMLTSKKTDYLAGNFNGTTVNNYKLLNKL